MINSNFHIFTLEKMYRKAVKIIVTAFETFKYEGKLAKIFWGSDIRYPLPKIKIEKFNN